jgi:DGQHR domain-containing protein
LARKKKKRLSAAERKKIARERAFKRQVRSIFSRSGFKRVPEISDKEFTYKGTTSDFDDAFVYENLIVLCEYTLGNETNTGQHFKNKVHLYRKIYDEPKQFLEFYRERFPKFDESISANYHKDQLRLQIAYFSEHELKLAHSGLEPRVATASRGVVQYFRSLANTIEKSARHELFNFLDIAPNEVGDKGKIDKGEAEIPHPGSLLPEVHSEFPPGYKVISFYVTPNALLRRAYVLRRDGWRDSDGLYQRMIDKRKISSIRSHLKEKRRVFVNNVVVTLPPDTRLDNTEGENTNPAAIHETTSINVKLRDRPNSVGIIDGQHRIFAYYEGVNDDIDIAVFRDRQNILATGIIYPENTSDEVRMKFEAELFLEINSNQNSAKSDLKQAISVTVRPFSVDSIGKRVVNNLSKQGPLEGLLQRSYFETDLLKTSSMVSFALARLVKIEGNESLFKLIEQDLADRINDENDLEALEALSEYVNFCSGELRKFLGAAKANLGSDKWSIKTRNGSGVLTVTAINALIILFRKVAMRDGLSSFETYKRKLSGLSSFKFGDYRSSQYNRMADAILRGIYDA